MKKNCDTFFMALNTKDRSYLRKNWVAIFYILLLQVKDKLQIWKDIFPTVPLSAMNKIPIWGSYFPIQLGSEGVKLGWGEVGGGGGGQSKIFLHEVN
jgi:hypothetical protein